MSWGEAFRMVEILVRDPSSQLSAEMAGWQYAATRGELTLRDLYDLEHQSKSKKRVKAYPRPWDAPVQKIGAGTSVTVAEFEAIRAAMASKHSKKGGA